MTSISKRGKMPGARSLKYESHILKTEWKDGQTSLLEKNTIAK